MNEEVLFDGNGVQITTSRVVAGGETYALRNITSVRTERGGSWAWPIVLIVIGLPMVSAALGGGEVTVPLLVLGIAVLAAAAWQIRNALGTKIVITSSGSERVAYRTSSGDVARRVIQALNDAIARR